MKISGTHSPGSLSICVSMSSMESSSVRWDSGSGGVYPRRRHQRSTSLVLAGVRAWSRGVLSNRSAHTRRTATARCNYREEKRKKKKTQKTNEHNPETITDALGLDGTQTLLYLCSSALANVPGVILIHRRGAERMRVLTCKKHTQVYWSGLYWVQSLCVRLCFFES